MWTGLSVPLSIATGGMIPVYGLDKQPDYLELLEGAWDAGKATAAEVITHPGKAVGAGAGTVVDGVLSAVEDAATEAAKKSGSHFTLYSLLFGGAVHYMVFK